MTTGNEAPDYGVTLAMLDGVQDRRVAAAIRQHEQDAARKMWPVYVNEALRLLGGKVQELERRIAAIESGRG